MKLLTSKIGFLLCIATLVLIAPVMALWIYTIYPPEPTSEQLVIDINEFEYAPIVTLPGAPIVTTPEETEPPTPPEESTPDPGVTPPGPGETTPEETTPEETTPEETTPPPIIQPELDGTNHYNLITLIVGSLQECLDLGIEEDAYEAANLNHASSYLYNELIRNNQRILHSAHTNTSGGNIVKDLENANAHKLHFSVVMNSTEDEVVVYSYEAVGKSDEGKTIEVYRTVAKLGVVNGVERWYPDLYSVQVGTAKVVKQSGKQIIDINSFKVTPQN